MSEPSRSPKPWWRSFFDDTYARVALSDCDPELASRIADFLVNVLEISEGDLLFDQCCGVGRVSLPLARRGVRVIGVDLVETYVVQAREATRGLPAEFHCADACEYVTDRPCDAAINWFTSIGYSDDDEMNARVLQRACESLCPGAKYAVEFQNMARICGQFISRHFHYGDADDPSSVYVVEEAKADLVRGKIDGVWTFLHPDGRREQRQISVRMYMPHELVKLLRRVGFGEVKLFGSIEGEPMDLKSRRCIAVARKE